MQQIIYYQSMTSQPEDYIFILYINFAWFKEIGVHFSG